ncbi:MAG: VWA domain-containing protein, partial [Deltaproteobacteria bacterium]|nr:VWA domain-containing protein [Deltaproteobacteria bacterium]
MSFALLGTFIGFAIDFGHAYLEKARISRLVDGAALAAAKALKGQSGYEDEATRAACDSMVMNGAPVVMDGALSCTATTGAPLTVALSFFDVPVEGGPPIKHVSVTGTEPVSTTFLNFLSWMVPGDYTKINVSAMAEAAPERPIDLMLVLDRSGSMGPLGGTDSAGKLKIESLKIAVNAFLGLSNTFSSDDRIGLVSFATRGCGNASGLDSTATTCTPDMALDYTTSSYITALQNKVNGLCNGGTNCSGGTNTMEALRVARPPLATAFDDPTRATTRKAVLLVTDGQPTFTRRDSDSECRRNPLNGNLLPNPNGNTNAGAGGPTFSNGCKQGVPSYTSTSANPWMYRARLSAATCYVMIPGTWTSTNCPGSQTPNT